MEIPQNDIFISHSSKDHRPATSLWNALKARGYRCWIAPHSIAPAEAWTSEIRKGVQGSTVVALLLSAQSEASKEVLYELHLADKFGVKIVPIRLDGCEAINLERYVWNAQWVNLSVDPFDEQVETIVDQLVPLLQQQKLLAELKDENTPSQTVGSDAEIQAEIEALQQEEALVQESSTNENEPQVLSALQIALNERGLRRENWIYSAVLAGDTDVEARDRVGQTALHYIAKSNLKERPEGEQMHALRTLLQAQADPNAQASDGTTPLHLAAQYNRVDAARLLLLWGADHTIQNARGLTALDLAQAGKCRDATHLLELWARRSPENADAALEAAMALSSFKRDKILDAIAAGAENVALTDRRGMQPLHWAALEGEPELVALLLKKGADREYQMKPHGGGKNGDTPLRLAQKRGHSEVVELLSQSKLSLAFQPGKVLGSVKSVVGETVKRASERVQDVIAKPTVDEANQALARALSEAESWWAGRKMKSALSDGATQVNLTDENGRTPLYWAAKHDWDDVTRLLLEKGADPHIADRKWVSPLSFETEAAQVIYEFLYEGPHASAQPSLSAKEANALFKRALLLEVSSKPKALRAALKAGAGANLLNLCDAKGKTALHGAALDGDVELMELLIQKGAYPNALATRESGGTPLHLAVQEGVVSSVPVLLAAQADAFSRPDKNGKVALQIAVENDRAQIVALLLEAAPNPSAEGGKCLIWAKASRAENVLTLLCNRGIQ